MENPYTEEWLTDFMDFDNQGQNAQGFQPARHLAPAQEQVMQTESKIPEEYVSFSVLGAQADSDSVKAEGKGSLFWKPWSNGSSKS